MDTILCLTPCGQRFCYNANYIFIHILLFITGILCGALISFAFSLIPIGIILWIYKDPQWVIYIQLGSVYLSVFVVGLICKGLYDYRNRRLAEIQADLVENSLLENEPENV